MGNLAKGSPLIKKLIFFVSYLTRAEAHQLPEAARQMYGMSLCRDDVMEISHYLEREHRKKEARGIREKYVSLLAGLKAENPTLDSEPVWQSPHLLMMRTVCSICRIR